MRKNNNFDFEITEMSINKINYIISKMEKYTFHNHYHIIYDLCTFLNKPDIIYMEIGAFAGGSASLMSTHKNVIRVISIDIGYPISKEIPINNVNKFKHENCTYEYIESDSTKQETKELVVSKIKNVDILFIDGDHEYNAVVKDFENYKDLVVKNGFIIFDDYLDSIHSPDVFKAVNDIVNTLNKDEYEIIGSLSYDLLGKTNSPQFLSSNEFIIRKLV
jgi:predicted O-methyltransferase YrrM